MRKTYEGAPSKNDVFNSQNLAGSAHRMSGRPANFPPPLRDVTCYYCNQVMSEGFLQTHTLQCDLVLEKCPNGCGAFIQRRYRALHVKNECSRRAPQQQRPREIPINQDNLISEIIKLRSALIEERRLRHVAVDEWRQKYDAMEAWNKKLVGVLAAFKENLQEEQQQRQQETAEWRLEMETMKQRWLQASAIQHVDCSWRGDVQVLRQTLAEERQIRERMQTEISLEMENIQKLKNAWEETSVVIANMKGTERTQLEDTLKILREERIEHSQREQEWETKYNNLERMYHDIAEWRYEYGRDVAVMKNMLEKEQEQRNQECQQWKTEIEKLPRRCLAEDHLNKELDELRIVLRDYKKEIEKETGECKKEVAGFKDFLSRENAMISGVWMDLLKKVDDLDKEIHEKITDMMKNVTLQRLQLKDVEDSLLKRDDYLHASTQKPGRLLWRIDDFKKKMEDAKENDTALHSPVFYSSQFGYKLRLEVKLNGLGQWKGRHIIVSLQVLEGEWDPLLPWPFSQKVSLTLRDQVRNADEAKDLVKTLTAGRAKEDPSGLHLFIPHKTMEQHNYIREDCVFLEAIVVC